MRISRVVLGGAVLALAGLSACSSSSSPKSTAASLLAEPCAWPWVGGVQNYNLAFPDSAAYYWAQPIVAGPSTSITVVGTYPNARYFSLSVYTPYGDPFSRSGVTSSLPDYRIEPSAGSVNPWQHRADPGGHFEAVIRSDVAPSHSNVLPLPPGTSALHPGYLVYRVYLPAGGTGSHITPPTITLRQDSANHTLSACRTHTPPPAPEKAPGGRGATGRSGVPPPRAFYKPDFQNGVANADTAYVWAYIVRPAASDVLVVRAKAPTFAPGASPSPWPAAGEDMRYWSMCIAVGTTTVPTVVNPLPGGETDYGCRADDATKLDAAGYYTYVMGSETQRAAILKIPGATFLPFSSTQTTPLYLLLLRNLLVNPSFSHSAQNVTLTNDAPATATAMGAYYPKVSTCALSTLTTGGVSACLSQ
jgi:hypothetical protein